MLCKCVVVNLCAFVCAYACVLACLCDCDLFDCYLYVCVRARAIYIYIYIYIYMNTYCILFIFQNVRVHSLEAYVKVSLITHVSVTLVIMEQTVLNTVSTETEQ